MSRVLWLGDAGAHTGFARVTHAIGDRLVTDYGHDVHCLAVNYLGDYWPTPIKMYVPTQKNPRDLYGQGRILELLGSIDPDVVVMLNDAPLILKILLANPWDPERMLLRYKPILSYIPVDGINAPPAWGRVTDFANVAIMSEWGRTLYPRGVLVPHGVDTDLFRPVSERPVTTSAGKVVRSKAEAKRAFGWDPDDFVVLRVDRNSRRKDFAATWAALTPVMRRFSDVRAHFHCKPQGDDGFELQDLISRDPETAKRIAFPGKHSTRIGWAEEDLVALYNAADVFVSTSWGEGFGLTLAEALACGVPVIAQDCSAITETVGPGGILVKPLRTIAVNQGQDMWLPDTEAFTDALIRLYQSKGARRELGEAGLQHVRSKFDWNRAAATFDRLITDLAAQREVLPVENPVHGPEVPNLQRRPQGVRG